MREIVGKYNTAICYANIIENEAIEQIRRMCDQPFIAGSKIRIMPDVHAGKGCTIGTTMTISDKVVVNIVGVDQGCGMYTVDIGKEPADFVKVDEAAHIVPSGMNVWDTVRYPFDLTQLRCYKALKNTQHLERSLGTLGGGNHFVEIDRAEDGTQYLVIHSGSRNIGKQVAEYYQSVAVELAGGKDDFLAKKENVIKELKETGRQSEIQNTLEKLSEEFRNNELDIPEELCPLYGPQFEDYLHDANICQEFARQNREAIANEILQYAGLTGGFSFHTIHNYINTSEMILRKGAIAAHENELVLIPINMRDGSVLARGRGNPEWNYSAPHGAGRLMSRKSAKNFLSMDEYKFSMNGIYTTSVNESTLDEAPMAYKSLEDIIGVIQESVDIIEVLKPVYNFKAG